MNKLPVLLTRLDDDIPDDGDVSARLRRYLMRLRGHVIDKSDIDAFHIAMDPVTDDDVAPVPNLAEGRSCYEQRRPARGDVNIRAGTTRSVSRV